MARWKLNLRLDVFWVFVFCCGLSLKPQREITKLNSKKGCSLFLCLIATSNRIFHNLNNSASNYNMSIMNEVKVVDVKTNTHTHTHMCLYSYTCEWIFTLDTLNVCQREMTLKLVLTVCWFTKNSCTSTVGTHTHTNYPTWTAHEPNRQGCLFFTKVCCWSLFSVYSLCSCNEGGQPFT